MRAQVIENVAPLGASAAYTSGARDMRQVTYDFGVSYTHLVAEVDSDQSGTVEIDQSTDMIIWASVQAATDYTGDSGILSLSVMVTERYARAKFVNESVSQTRFTMTTGVDQS